MQAIIIIIVLFGTVKNVTCDLIRPKVIYTMEVNRKSGLTDTIRIKEKHLHLMDKNIVSYKVLKSNKIIK